MTTATILPTARTVFLDSNNNPVSGGFVYFYVPPNTTTLKMTWQDATGTIPNTNPVILDGNGSALIYGSGQYLQEVYDSLGNLIYTGLTQDVYGLIVNGNNTFTGSNTFNGSTTFNGLVTFDDTTINSLSSYFPTYKNRVLNGDMRIDQSNEGSSVALTNGVATYVCDGTVAQYVNATAVITAQQISGGTSGFSNVFKVTVGTGASSIDPADYIAIQANLEGYSVADFYYGTATATTGSLSFWVNTNTTGTYSYCLRNSANDRAYVGSFTLTTANSWTKISVPAIPGDITGTWLSTNGNGLQILIVLSAGTAFQTNTLDAWQGNNVLASTSQTNTMLTTNNAAFQLTGLQWEKGDICTAYEFLPYETSLSMCQRQYYKSFPPGTKPAQNGGVSDAIAVISNASSAFGASLPYKVTMRGTPIITTYNPLASNANWRDSTNSADRTVTVGTVGQNSVVVTGAAGVASATNIIHFTANARL